MFWCLKKKNIIIYCMCTYSNRVAYSTFAVVHCVYMCVRISVSTLLHLLCMCLIGRQKEQIWPLFE